MTVEDFGGEDIKAYHQGKSHNQAAYPRPRNKWKLILRERFHILIRRKME